MTAYSPKSPAIPGWKRVFFLALAVALGLLVLLMLGDLALSHNRVHSGVTVAGIEVGRATREAASAELGAAVSEAQGETITLAGEDQKWEVLPADLGTRIDVEGTVAEAYALTREGGFFSDLRTRFSLYFSPRDVALRGTVESSLIDAKLEEIGEALDVAPVNAGLEVTGTDIRVIEGKSGRVVDREALRDSLKNLLFSLHETTLPIPMKTLEPAIQAANTQQAVAQAKTMVSGAVTLEAGKEVWTVGPEKLASYLDFKVEGEGTQSQLVPFVSAEKAKPLLDQVAEAVSVKPNNAGWETDGERATIVPAVTGKTLDQEQTAQAITTAAKATEERTAEAQVREQQPERTTEKAKEMGIVSKLAAFTTNFSGSENRRDNVQRAGQLISGTLLAPGEEFDFDRVVGKRTPENGFKTAPAIVGGKLEDTLGGGICQVATTLYNAVFFAGLDVTSRRNHSLYISHYPKGRDATVSWGGPAFRFRNDTGKWVLIKSASTRSSLTFVIYGTPEGREVTYTTSDWYNVQSPAEKRVKSDTLAVGQTKMVDEGQTGRSVKVVRKVVRDGKVVHDDTFVSTYPMRPKVIEEGTRPADTTTTTAKPTTTTAPPSTTPPPSTTTTVAG